MAENKTYNGWTNYETWAVALWLDNEQGSYHYWRERAQEILEEARADLDGDAEEEAKQTAQNTLADALKEQHEEANPLTEKGSASVFTDLLNAALSEVNWHEIAGNLLEECE